LPRKEKETNTATNHEPVPTKKDDGFVSVKKRERKPKKVEKQKRPLTELTFENMVIGNSYVVFTEPDYYIQFDENDGDKFKNKYVMKCVGKEIDKDGQKWVSYSLTTTEDDYLECRYTVLSKDVFKPETFSRLPEGYWTNPSKFLSIHREYDVDHVEISDIW